VDSVVGLRSLDLAQMREQPPLLRYVNADIIESIGTCDEQLLLLLRAASILTDDVWETIKMAEALP
jgi:chemotaxis signal transduction protein